MINLTLLIINNDKYKKSTRLYSTYNMKIVFFNTFPVPYFLRIFSLRKMIGNDC